LGWLRGERGHCSMARVPTIAEEDAKRPNRERECLVGALTSLKNQCISHKVGHFFFRCFSPVFGTSVPPLLREQ
jgi:hypothetical protein